MTEYPASSPVVARSWCPLCEPLADPTLEILDVRYCDQHTPARAGPDDGIVTSEGALSGGTEAGGDANRLWCQLLHRDAPRDTARARRARREPAS